MNNKKLVVIIPYFGHFPPWFEYFLQSCANNPDIDWLMYSNNEFTSSSGFKLPENVQLKTCSFEAYCQRVENRLGIKFKPASPYKLCDLKPCLGYLHEEEITGYDFWAFGDVDVIYGDIHGYINEDMLKQDLVSFHAHRISGHLCLLRNSQRMREAFKKFKGWKEVLSDPEHRCFDEKDYNAIFMKHKNWPVKVRRAVYFFDSYMRKTYFEESYSTHFSRNVEWKDGSQNFPTQWRYDNGILTSDDAEQATIPYLHFMEWKRQWKSGTEFQAKVAQQPWLINEKGFFNE